MAAPRVLLVGSGSLGRVFGARLERAGRKVVFYRPPEREPLPPAALCEDRRTGERLHLPMRAASWLPKDLGEYEAAAVLVRYEGLESAAAELAAHEHVPPVCVFTPVLFPGELEALAARTSVAACFPRVEALPPENGRVVFQVSGVQRVLAAGGGTRARELWTRLLGEAGFPARQEARPLGALCAVYAFGIPMLLGLDRAGYDTRALARDRGLLRGSWLAAREGLEAGIARGAVPPWWVRTAAAVPPGLAASAASLGLRLTPGFAREMLERHFKKVAEQTRLVAKRLAAAAGPDSALSRLLELQ